mmetsp:Transcript_45919/g.58980  ORF Transcript_45919/g.58980 Transcript_45919/m.58980 type:complete len:308 (+) Transcript_45919:361-1284(+)
MKSYNNLLNNKIHQYSSNNNNIAMDADDVLTIVNDIESEQFDDLWIDDIHLSIRNAHIQRRKRIGLVSNNKFVSNHNHPNHLEYDCSEKTEIDLILLDKMKLLKASGASDYASIELGGTISFINKLTSPSYPQTGAILSGTMKHVLHLKSNFPSPESVITPYSYDVTTSSNIDPSTSSSNKRSPYVAQCWAFSKNKGVLTIQLAQPTRITHVSYQHRLVKEATKLETSAAPKLVQVWSLSSASDQHPISLGSFIFDINGASRQTFAMTNQTQGNQIKSSLISFEVKSNHGNNDFTCLHKLRAHSVTD